MIWMNCTAAKRSRDVSGIYGIYQYIFTGSFRSNGNVSTATRRYGICRVTSSRYDVGTSNRIHRKVGSRHDVLRGSPPPTRSRGIYQSNVQRINDHILRKHWKVVPLKSVPQYNKPIPMVWSMKWKHNPIGEIVKWKARLWTMWSAKFMS